MDIGEGEAPAGAPDFIGREFSAFDVFKNGFTGFYAQVRLDFGKGEKVLFFFAAVAVHSLSQSLKKFREYIS